MNTEILFEDLAISKEIIKALDDMGFKSPSPIQAESIPVLLEGKDVIGQAQTGTGKTAAFGIPLVNKIDTSIRGVQGLILCPTRELAVQVSEEIKKISRHVKGLKVLAIYGGESIERQIRGLENGVQIVVGTPGRVIDHIERRTLSLSNVQTIILDEADEMLNMGFVDDIKDILEKIPETRQSVFFSATMPSAILDLTRKFMNDPVIVKITRKEISNPNIKQTYYETRSDLKVEAMCRLIDFHNLKLMLAFCNTKKKVDELVEELIERGYSAEGMHGDMRQGQRNIVMQKFRSGLVNILVATDVAARGIDVDSVEAVFNYDLPQDQEYYVHRIGRTGRAGKNGLSFSFVTRRDSGMLRDIERYIKSPIEKDTLPDVKLLETSRFERFAASITEKVTQLDGKGRFSELLNTLVAAGNDPQLIAESLMELHFGGQLRPYKDVEFEDRKSVRRDDDRGGRDRDRRPSRDRDDRGRDRDRGDRAPRGDRDRDRAPRGDRDRGDRPERGDRERSPRREGDDKKPANNRPVNPNDARLYISVGRNNNVRPGDLVGAIANEAGIKGSDIGQIDIFDRFSFVSVPNEVAQQVIKSMNNNTIKGIQVNVEISGNK